MSEMVVHDAAIVPRVEREHIGVIETVRRSFFGEKEITLQEDKARISVVTIITMAVMSFFGMYLFAYPSIQSALRGDVISGILALAIVLSFLISDYAAPLAREMARLSHTRNDTQQARLFSSYAKFVYFADGYTVTMVFARTFLKIPDTAPPIDLLPIPHFGTVSELIIRGLLVTFTAYIIHDVTKKPLADWYTFARKHQERTGGIILKGIGNKDMPFTEAWDQFVAAMNILSKPAVTPAQKAEETRIKQLQLDFKNALTSDVKAKSDESTNAIVTELGELKAVMMTFLSALQDGSLTGSKKPSKASTTGNETGYKAMLSTLDITPVTSVYRLASDGTKEKKGGAMLRGGWINSADIITLSDNQYNKDDATKLARSLGQGYKVGTMYACPLPAVLRELEERNKLHSTVQEYMISSTKATDTSDQ